MDAGEDTLAQTRWRGPVLLGLGVGLCTVGVLSACGGPSVIPYRAPTTPVVALEPLEDGEVVVAGAVNNSAVVLDDDEVFMVLWPGASGEVFDVGGGYSATAALGVQRFELRTAVERNARGWMTEAGVGLRLPSFGQWTPVVDGGVGYQDIADEYTQQVDTAEGITEEEDIAYQYRVVAPSVRVRLVWQPSERLSVPVSARWIHSRTLAVSGLDGVDMPTENYLDLGVGAVYRPGAGCLQLGVGVSMDPRFPKAGQLQASLGCRGALWGGAQ